MATFGSYGNLGGELVQITEIQLTSSRPIGASTTTLFTVPIGRYALVIERNSTTTEVANLTCNYSIATGTTTYLINDTEGRIANEGEAVNIVSNNTAFVPLNANINILIFEYRKP